MNTEEEIKKYINSQKEAKRSDMQILHTRILELLPDCRIWFSDGKNEEGKIVANPSIGYGFQIMKYADGSTRDFYRIGLSGNTTGLSIYILGLKDKTFLKTRFGDKLGKASVTGYCIKFKSLQDIHLPVLEEAILYGGEMSEDE